MTETEAVKYLKFFQNGPIKTTYGDIGLLRNYSTKYKSLCLTKSQNSFEKYSKIIENEAVQIIPQFPIQTMDYSLEVHFESSINFLT